MRRLLVENPCARPFFEWTLCVPTLVAVYVTRNLYVWCSYGFILNVELATLLLLLTWRKKTRQRFHSLPSFTHRLTEAWKIFADKFNSQASVEPLTGGCQRLAGQMCDHCHMTVWLWRETEKKDYFPLSLCRHILHRLTSHR